MSVELSISAHQDRKRVSSSSSSSQSSYSSFGGQRYERGLNFFTVIVLFTAVLGGSTFGLDIGSAAVTSMDGFRTEMGLALLVPGVPQDSATSNKVTYFTVFFHLATLVGAPFSGAVADRMGRKLVILIACALFAAGALWQSLAGLLGGAAYTSIILGRCLGGIGNGFMLTIMPVYACELSPPKYRGGVVTLFQLFITLGILIMAGINKGIENVAWGWRLGLAIQILPCVIILILTLCILPESPRYLISKDRYDECDSAMRRLAMGSADAELCIRYETYKMKEEVEEEKAVGKGSFIELFRGPGLPALMCGFMVAFSQNVTGVNWLMNYATSLFSSLGLDSFTYDLILKGVNSGATIVSLFVIDRLGRKWLTVWGTILVIAVFLVIACVLQATGVIITDANPDSRTKKVQIFVVIFLFMFQALFAITWGPVGWLVPGEVFPLRLRGIGMSMAVVANMITNIALGDYGYQQASVSSLGITGTIWLVVGLNIIIVLPTVFFLQPETKEVSLEEMRFVFGYEKGGNQALAHGTIKQFFGRNFMQVGRIVTCRQADARMGFDRFDGLHQKHGKRGRDVESNSSVSSAKSSATSES